MAPHTSGNALHGVLFAEDFDDPPVRGRDAAGPSAPSATPATETPVPAAAPPGISPEAARSAEEAARQAGYAAGHAAGHAAGLDGARSAMESRRVAVAEQVLAMLGEIADEAKALLMAQAESAARAVFGVLVACLPALCEQRGKEEMLRTLRLILPPLVDEPELVVTLHPEHASTLVVDLAHAIPFADRMKVETSVAMGLGDVRVAWRHGNASRDAASLQAGVRTLLAEAGLLPEASTPMKEHNDAG